MSKLNDYMVAKEDEWDGSEDPITVSGGLCQAVMTLTGPRVDNRYAGIEVDNHDLPTMLAVIQRADEIGDTDTVQGLVAALSEYLDELSVTELLAAERARADY